MAVGATRPDGAKNEHGVTVWVNGPLGGEGIVETGNTVTPGCAVVPGTAEDEVVQAAADATNSLGWSTDNIGADDPAVDTWKDLRIDYAADERVTYSSNVGDRFMGPLVGLAGDTTYSYGDYLVVHADGYQPYTATTAAADNDTPDEVIARYIGKADVTVTDGSTEYALLEWGGL